MKKFSTHAKLDELTLNYLILQFTMAKSALDNGDTQFAYRTLDDIKAMDAQFDIEHQKVSDNALKKWVQNTLTHLKSLSKEEEIEEDLELEEDDDWDLIESEHKSEEKSDLILDDEWEDIVPPSKAHDPQTFVYGTMKKGQYYDINKLGFNQDLFNYCLGLYNTPGPLQLKTLDHLKNPLPAQKHSKIAHVFTNPNTQANVVLCKGFRMPYEKARMQDTLNHIKENLNSLAPPIRVILPMGENYTGTGHQTLLAVDIFSKTNCQAVVFDSLTKSYLRSAKSYMMGYAHKNSSQDIRDILESEFSQFPKDTVIRHYYSHQNALTEHNCGAHSLNIAHYCMDHLNMSLDEVKQCLPTANGYWSADNFLTQDKYQAILEFAAGAPNAHNWYPLTDQINNAVEQRLSQVKSQAVKHSDLYQAAASGDMTALKKSLSDESLKRADSDKQYKDKDGHSSILIVAAQNNHFKAVSEILRQHDQHHVCAGLRSIKTQQVGTALNVLVEKACFVTQETAHTDCLQAIKDYMTSITENYSTTTRFEDYCSQPNASGQTPLHIIAATNQTKLLDCLAQFKCQGWSGTYETRHIFDFTKKNAQGQTPLELAAERGHVDVLQAMYALNPKSCPKNEYAELLTQAREKKASNTTLLFQQTKQENAKTPLAGETTTSQKKPKLKS